MAGRVLLASSTTAWVPRAHGPVVYLLRLPLSSRHELATQTPVRRLRRPMYGTDEETAKKVQSLQGKYAWAEGIKGANDEARLCLRGKKSW